MVYIRRIDLRGFKTFGKKVSLTLDRGLTVVTGPNGSGKSNVIDSVKFALGELSAKELRGGTITDLIHRGSPHVASKSAYVGIQFDNADRRLPVDSDAVTISREFRRGGEGIYRLNGRRVSRKQLTDILSSADIQVSGHNIVQQHAITRLAEVTLEERRKIIEDMIGIAVYDSKKAESQLQLQQADLNIKVASARTDEVRMRVEALEKERNDYLRSQQLKRESERFQAQLASSKINQVQVEIANLRHKIDEKRQIIEHMKAKKTEISQRREEVESQRTTYEETVVDRGSAELFNIERVIGDANAKAAGLKAGIGSSEKTISALERQRADLERQASETDRHIEAAQAEIAGCKDSLLEMIRLLERKRQDQTALSESLSELRERLCEGSSETDAREQEIANLTKKIVEIDGRTKGSSSKITVLEGHLQTLGIRAKELRDLKIAVERRTGELSKLVKDEKSRLDKIETVLLEYASVEKEKQIEVSHAAEVSKKARLTLAEIESQKNVAEILASDDRALQLIEEMGRAGALVGVHGRLCDLVHFEEEHGKAIEVASAGWLRAVVVKDIDCAIRCIESLKRTKLGRVKLIPIQSLVDQKKVETPTHITGLMGCIADYIKLPDQYRPAVHFVFGDTMLAATQRSAFMASLEGYRAVSLAGDLYEPGGGMEIGYYREPLDARKLVPKQSAIANVASAVKSLEDLLERSKKDLERLRNEIITLNESRAASKNLIDSMGREAQTIKQDLARTEKTIQSTESRIATLVKEIETENTVVKSSKSTSGELQDQLDRLMESRSSLGLKAKSDKLAELQRRHAVISDEVNRIIQQKLEHEGRISTLEASITARRQGHEHGRLQTESIDGQIAELRVEIETEKEQLATALQEIDQVQKRREIVLKNLTAVKSRRSEFEQTLKKLESQMMTTINQLESLNREMSELDSAAKEKEMRASLFWDEMKRLGYNEVIEVDPNEVRTLEESLSALKRELERIGAVNALAVTQYEDQKNNYKQLASRIYEIEKERHAIIEFMNELDQKKHDMFMRAFNQISDEFQEIFTKITGSGRGRMILESPEEPFKGGVDVLLEFPGKSEMPISSASGGEKSVGTVCFLLALQAIHPMPFYVFDEIDAHLDVLNSQRLAELLRERSKGSQFIVISLKDTAISRGNRVYGVFIQDGVSQIISMPLAEVMA